MQALAKALASSPILTAANDNFPCRLVHNSEVLNSATVYSSVYSKANRLASISGSTVSPAITAMMYDAFGKRIVKTDASNTYLFTYDQSGNLIEERKGTAITDYIYADGVNLGNWQVGGGHVFLINPDARGVPLVSRDEYGTTNWAAYTEPYGAMTVTVSTGAFSGPVTQNLRLPGQYYDYEISTLSYNLQRDYLNTLGRYIESDPIGLTGGLNTYGYALQNPLIYTDPSGEITAVEIPVIRAVGALIAIGVYEQFHPLQCHPNIFNSDNADSASTPSAGESTPGQTPLPDDAIVCRGGQCTEERFTGGSGVTTDSDGNIQGVSVGVGGSVEEAAPQGYGQVGVTTVGDIRGAGGDVISSPTPGNPNHATLGGITAGQAQGLFTPTIKNPNR
jgi:RHS repeat-associated protein